MTSRLADAPTTAYVYGASLQSRFKNLPGVQRSKSRPADVNERDVGTYVEPHLFVSPFGQSCLLCGSPQLSAHTILKATLNASVAGEINMSTVLSLQENPQVLNSRE